MAAGSFAAFKDAFAVAPLGPLENVVQTQTGPRLRMPVKPEATSSTHGLTSAVGMTAIAGLAALASSRRRSAKGKTAGFIRKAVLTHSSRNMSAVSMSAVSTKPIVLTGDTLMAALKMRCEIAGAGYAIYWTKVGDEFVTSGEYVIPAQIEALKAKGMSGSFLNGRSKKNVDVNGDNALAAVADSGLACFIQDASTCTIVDQAHVEEYGLESICFVPVEGGILEYGTTKDDCNATWSQMPVCPVIPKRQMRDGFENFGAGYAVFWMEKNGWYSASTSYITEQYRRALKIYRGDDKTYCSEVSAIKLPADGEDLVAEAARTGRMSYLASSDDETHESRKALLKEFGIDSTYFVPVVGGVLEYGRPASAGLSGNTLKASLKMCCDTTGACYALYWIRVGDEFVVSDSYVTPAHRAKLQADGKNGSFAEASEKVKLSHNDESAVTMVAASGCACFVPDIESHTMYFCRTEEAEEYKINTIALLPIEGGVLEYGNTKEEILNQATKKERLQKLEAEKLAAFEAHDYDRCKELQPEIAELQTISGLSVDWTNSPRCPEFPKAEIKRAFDEMNASYILFWQKRGNSYVVSAEYVVPEHQQALRNSRNDDETYASKSREFILPVDGDGCVPTAVRAGKEIVIADAAADATFKRQHLAKEFKVGEVHLVPCSDGVLEFCVANA